MVCNALSFKAACALLSPQRPLQQRHHSDSHRRGFLGTAPVRMRPLGPCSTAEGGRALSALVVRAPLTGSGEGGPSFPLLPLRLNLPQLRSWASSPWRRM